MKKKKALNIDDLSIEVTRRCNMSCAHCMRGPARRVDMTEEVLETFLSQVRQIGVICFTGGEPSLNVPAMKKALEICKREDIFVGGVYLVTNGKDLSDEFFSCMLEWYMYCIGCSGEPDLSGIALSKDVFHEKVKKDVENKLKAFSFYRDDEKNMYVLGHDNLINLGRAKEITTYCTKEKGKSYLSVEESDEGLHIEGYVSLTAIGEVLADCDYEYANTDEIRICAAKDAAETFKKIATDPDYKYPVGCAS